jgi:hypothetical protein
MAHVASSLSAQKHSTFHDLRKLFYTQKKRGQHAFLEKADCPRFFNTPLRKLA